MVLSTPLRKFARTKFLKEMGLGFGAPLVLLWDFIGKIFGIAVSHFVRQNLTGMSFRPDKQSSMPESSGSKFVATSLQFENHRLRAQTSDGFNE